MTLSEKFDIPKNASFDEKYATIVNKLGFEQVKRFIPFSKSEIRKAYVKDKHLNNLPMKEWDKASGFSIIYDKQTRNQRVLANKHGLRTLLPQGVVYSLADCVCILKCCARMWAKTENMKN